MALLDAFIVNVGLPTIRSTLNANAGELELVIASYSLTYGIFLITGGRLGDIFGRKRLFVVGMAVFTIASATCGLAPSPEILIVFQGVARLWRCNNVSADPFNNPSNFQRSKARHRPGSVRRCQRICNRHRPAFRRVSDQSQSGRIIMETYFSRERSHWNNRNHRSATRPPGIQNHTAAQTRLGRCRLDWIDPRVYRPSCSRGTINWLAAVDDCPANFVPSFAGHLHPL